MEKKSTTLEKMKNAKSFLSAPSGETGADNKKHALEKASLTELDAEIPKAPNVEEPGMFSEPAVLFKKKDDVWAKISSGTVIGKEIENKGVQLLFAMDNTRIVMNTLINDMKYVKAEEMHFVFMAIEEQETAVGCLLFKSRETPQKILGKIEDSLKKMSPPGIEPGTSSV